MDDLDGLADEAEVEIEAAKRQCVDSAYDNISREALLGIFRRWISHPKFDKDFNLLETTVLNELQLTPGLMD